MPRIDYSSPAGTSFLYGTLADRPAFGALNRYYWATDVYMLFRDTGAAWEIAGSTVFTRYITSTGFNGVYGSGNSGPISLASVRTIPLYVPFTCTIDCLGYGVGTVASGNIRLGLYGLGALGYPDLPDAGNLLVETASLAQPGTVRIHLCTVDDTRLTPGIYFVALQTDDAAATAIFIPVLMQLHHNVDGLVSIHRMFDLAYGAFPDPCPVTADADNSRCWWVCMRVKSIP